MKKEMMIKTKLIERLVSQFQADIKGKITTTSLFEVFNLSCEKRNGKECHKGFIMCDSQTLSDRKHQHRMANAYTSWQFGTPIVVDMWYNQAHQDLNMLITAFKKLLHTNFESEEPFFIHFTDINFDSQNGKAVKHLLEEKEDYFQGFHTKSFTDIFPKSQLIYLTPYTTQSIKSDHHMKFDKFVYVIGGLLDGPYNRMSAQRVQQLGVKARCFYKTQEISKNTLEGSVLSMDRSLTVLNKLKLGTSIKDCAKLFNQWAEVTKTQNIPSLQPFYQSLFEY